MPYATADDLRARYPADDLKQLTDPDGQVIDDDQLDRACADASGEIDGYLQGRYQLPFIEVPAALLLKCCDIAMYRLQVLRPLGSIEDARKRYEDATRYLDKVSTGTVQLGIANDGQAPAEQSGPTVLEGSQVFGRVGLKDF